MNTEQGHIAQEQKIEQMIRDLMDAAALSHNAEDVVAEDEAVEAIMDEITEYAADRVAEALNETEA